MEILAIIPARSGSKTVPHKNIRLMNGKPMIAYSIEHALKSRLITRVLVSTDSEEYKNIALTYGAEVPFLRPKEYAQDHSLDLDVFKHVLCELKSRENYIPDIVVQLRPTYPIRDIEDIDRMIEMLLQDTSVDSIRSIAPAKEIPFKMWYKDANGKLTPLIQTIPECYNMARQELPPVYYQNACIDVIRANVILEKQSMSGEHILGYVMKKNYDIDTEEEFLKAENYIRIMEGRNRYVFDIDGVIAKLQEKNDYSKSEPNEKMIQIVNELYHRGNYIVLFTARGYVTGIDWEKTTKRQLKEWGVSYHELHFGKPNADYYVDDKMVSLEQLLYYFE